MQRSTIAAIALLAVACKAHAADNGIYLGASLSRSTIDTEADFFGFRYKDNDTAYKLIGGVRPFNALAIEANYIDFGRIVFDDRDTVADGLRSEFGAQAIDASAVVFVGGPFIELFGKVGLVYWDADTVLQGGLSGVDLRDSDSGADFTWGAGAQASFSSLAVRLEFENFDMSDADTVELWSVGVTWTFL
ncbi:MAG: outer membrane beta-barrel protein [Halioglobus sp.]|nr:outer membrane beta-barrel protein [Halioglobus sp.]